VLSKRQSPRLACFFAGFSQVGCNAGGGREAEKDLGNPREYRMNIGDLRCSRRGVHSFCVRGLWTGCTRLIRGKLKEREFD
jgi:hypothetical protein